MSRLSSLGGESGAAPASTTATHPAEGGISGAGSWVFLGNAMTIQGQTLVPRSGQYFLRAASNLQSIIRTNIGTHVDGRLYVQGMGFRLSGANPGTAVDIIANSDSAIRINTNGTLNLRAAGVNVGSATPALQLGIWYYIELAHIITAAGNDYIEGWLNGISFAQQSGSSFSATLGSNCDFGPSAAYGASTTMDFDDIYVLDDQGSSPWNDRLGPKIKIVASMPVADISRDAGWTDNDNTTTNLWESINNRPPVAVTPAAAAGTADTQIKNAASTTTDNYVTEMQSAREAGVGPEDIIIASVLVTSHGIDSATSTTVTSHQILANNGHPGTTETNWDPNLASTNWPTNWTPGRTVTENPAIIDEETRPQVEIGKRTAATRVASVAQVRIDWIYLEGDHTPSPKRWPPWLKDIPGSTRLRRFPLPPPSVLIEEAPPSEDTPVPGGAIVAGNSPTAQLATLEQGGAVVDGRSPTQATNLLQGGAVAAGQSPDAATGLQQGGESGGGNAETGQTALTPGGLVAGGNSPSESFTTEAAPSKLAQLMLFFGPAGFRKMRRSPKAEPSPQVTQDTPTPGGAVVSGNSPTAQLTTLVQGGTVVNGNTTTATTNAAQGGATAAGQPPTASSGLQQGGEVGGGTETNNQTALTPGGLVAGGFGPSEVIEPEPTKRRKEELFYLLKRFTRARIRLLKRPIGTTAEPLDHETPIPGGATVGGFSPSAKTSGADFVLSGVTINGNAPTSATTPAQGGAITGGFSATAITATTPGGMIIGGPNVAPGTLLMQGGLTTGGFEPTFHIFVPRRKQPDWFLKMGPRKFMGFVKMSRHPKPAFTLPPSPVNPFEPIGSITKRIGIKGSVRTRTKGVTKRIQ